MQPSIKEYRDIKDHEHSQFVVIERRGKYMLGHRTAGYECAGSCARWTNEVWSVTFMLDNATHGRRFKKEDEAKARELFAQWAGQVQP